MRILLRQVNTGGQVDKNIRYETRPVSYNQPRPNYKCAQIVITDLANAGYQDTPRAQQIVLRNDDGQGFSDASGDMRAFLASKGFSESTIKEIIDGVLFNLNNNSHLNPYGARFPEAMIAVDYKLS